MRDFAAELSRYRCWDEQTERIFQQTGVPTDDTILQTRGELERLCAFFEREQIHSYLEIGVWTGRLALTLAELFRFERLAVCDLGLAERFGLTLHVSESAIPFYRGSSHSDGYLRWREQLGQIDATLIDGDHSYEGVLRDFELNSRFPGRFLIFHDIVGGNPSTVGVRRFWEELEGEKEEILAPHREAGYDRPTMGIGIWRIGSGQHRRRVESGGVAAELPFVSVVVPVKDDGERLSLCLTALEDQHYPRHRYEVIVVDDHSKENLAGTLRGFPQARLIRSTARGPAAARNAGARASQSEVIAFTDADCIPNPDWLLRGVSAIHLRKADLVGGRIQLHVSDPACPSAVELYEVALFGAQQQFVEQLHFAATANVILRRAVFERVSFDEELFDAASGEDMDWGARVHEAGFVSVYAAEVSVLHPARRHLLELLRKERLRLRGLFAFLEKHGADVEQRFGGARATLQQLSSGYRGAKLLPAAVDRLTRIRFVSICALVAVLAWFERRGRRS